MTELRIDGEVKFRGATDFAREMFWVAIEDYPGCAVELRDGTGVLDFIDEDGTR